MKFPKLKNPVLCRVLSYVVVIGGIFLPAIVISCFNFPEAVKIIAFMVCAVALIACIVKNIGVLMSMDMILATYACYKDARKKYALPHNITKDKIYRKISRYGIECDAKYKIPEPIALRYKFSYPLTMYTCGIERVIAAYEVDFLDRETYSSIVSTSKRNSNALRETKKARFLDKEQKKAPLNRVTVVLIFADNVDFQLSNDLYSTVCGSCGDEEKECILPCVINFADRTCVFNSVRVGYVGFTYAVKNRGIKFIKKYVFGKNMNLKDNQNYVEYNNKDNFEIDREETLWDLWRKLNNIINDDEFNKMFENMSEKEIRIDDMSLNLKWDHRGICQLMKLDEDNKTVQVATVDYWSYPKTQAIGKQKIKLIEEYIVSYYANKGYKVEFVDSEIFWD